MLFVSMRQGRRMAFLAGAATVWLSTAHAATLTWDGEGGDGQWVTANNWSGNAVPTSSDDVILDNTSVSGSYTVSLTGTQTGTCRTFTIGYPGNTNTITYHQASTGNNNNLMVVAGTGDSTDDFVIDEGGLFIYAGSVTGGNNTSFNNIATGNTSRVKSGGRILQSHNRQFHISFPPTGNGATTLESGSTVEFGQSGQASPNLTGISFGNLTFSSTSTKTFTPTGGGCTIKNDFTVGSGVTFSWSATTTTPIAIFQGDIVNNSSSLSITNSSGGGIEFDGDTTLSGSSALTLGVSLPITINSGKSLTLVSDLSIGDTITVNGTLQCNSSVVGGSGSVVVNSGATLGIAYFGGLPSQFNGGGTFDSGASYIYNGSAAQVTGSGLPATVDTLTIDNAAGVTLSGSVDALTLELVAGELATGSNTLSTVSVSRTGGQVTGALVRTVDASVAGARLFPVGTAGSYTPVTINITTPGTGTGTLTATSTGSDHPNALDPAHTANRFWTLSQSGLSGFTATLTFGYDDADLGPVVEADMLAGRYTGSGNVWDVFPTTLDTINNTATVTGVTAFSDWSIGDPGGLPVELDAFSVE